ncbi:MAG: hypothetical protein KDD40_04850, partial [Bdellovibrionales bacterium]|nr:hypothetical protein [Bdellovibrionales bacterium]
SLKSGGAVSASTATPESVEEENSELAAEAQASVEELPSEEAVSVEQESTAAPVEEENQDPITEDLISEFEQAVNEQLNGMNAEKEAESNESLAAEVGDEVDLSSFDEAKSDASNEKVEEAPAVEEPPVETKADEPTAESDSGADDIFGEFVPEAEGSSKDTLNAAVNTDKMLEEMSTLAEDTSDSLEGSALEQELDVEKMMSEAQDLDNKG